MVDGEKKHRQIVNSVPRDDCANDQTSLQSNQFQEFVDLLAEKVDDADFGPFLLTSETEKVGDENPGARALSSGLGAVAQVSSSSQVELEPRTADELDQQTEQDSLSSLMAPPDVLLLYWTLVKDRILARGFEAEFAALEVPISKGAKRAFKRTARADNLISAVWLHQRNTQQGLKERAERLAVDQFLLSVLDRPSKFRARWQEKFYDGPTARRDAGDALRSKRLQELAALLKDTRTPMSKVLESKAGDKNLPG